MSTLGDPSSSSALGGALRSQAIALADLLEELETHSRRASRAGLPDPTARERDLIARTASELDAVGAALQSWTATVVGGGARLRTLTDEAARAGLQIDGRIVVEAVGPSRVDPAERARSRARLQELLNRVSAAQIKQLHRVAREVERSSAALTRLSERARSGPE